MSNIKNTVSVEWLKNHLADKNLIILEANLPKVGSKEPSQFTNIQIVGSITFDLKNTFRNTESSLPNTIPSPEQFTEECQKLGINQNSKIVVYDNLGVYSSPRAWWLFRVMGHENVAVLDGGLPAWMVENLPSEPQKATLNYSKGDFVAHFQTEIFRNADQVFENLETKNALILDARSPMRFAGKTPEPRENLRSGHIPNSKNLAYAQVLNGEKLKPKNELSTLFSELNSEDKPLIFSCGSGITACIILLASELVSDVPKAVYDGSWTEWGQLQKLPIETT